MKNYIEKRMPYEKETIANELLLTKKGYELSARKKKYRQIQPAQSHKNYEFFVHPTLSIRRYDIPLFLTLSRRYFQQLKLMFEKVTNILGDKISKENLVHCLFRRQNNIGRQNLFHQYLSCPSDTMKTLLINSKPVISTL